MNRLFHVTLDDVALDNPALHRGSDVLTDEPVTIRNYLDADDTQSTLSALRALGEQNYVDSGIYTVEGVLTAFDPATNTWTSAGLAPIPRPLRGGRGRRVRAERHGR